MIRPRPDMRDEQGQTMVEFAMVLPVLCLLLFGVIQFGLIFNNYVTLTDAVRAGARKAAVSRQTTDPGGPVGVTQSAVYAAATDLDKAKLPPPSVSSTWQHGDPVTVCADYPWNINLVGVGIASGTLHTCTKERVE
jgi:Flp pilus assembly protein TadG